MLNSQKKIFLPKIFSMLLFASLLPQYFLRKLTVCNMESDILLLHQISIIKYLI